MIIMIKIKIIAVGSLKEKFLREALKEYEKRLSKFAKLEIIEVEETKIQSKSAENVKKEECERLLKKIGERDFLILLDVHGEIISSEELATKLDSLVQKGISPITFVIGGTLGLSEEIRKRANFRLSISKMTFTHQMCRVILLEQIYRAFKINNNEEYHH